MQISHTARQLKARESDRIAHGAECRWVVGVGFFARVELLPLPQRSLSPFWGWLSELRSGGSGLWM